MKSETRLWQTGKGSIAKSNEKIALLMTIFLLVLGAISLTVLINSPA